MTSPLNNLTDTWNNGATVFTGLKYNITNTASAPGSLLMDLQIGGSSKFNVDKIGKVSIFGPAAGNDELFSLFYDSGSTKQIRMTAYGQFFCTNNIGVGLIGTPDDVIIQGNGSGAVIIKSSGFLSICAGSPNSASFDTNLYRDAAGIFAQRNSANAQTLRVYNAFTDASNYERGVIDWTTTSNVLKIGAQAAGTGVLRMTAIVAFQKAGAVVAGDLPAGTFAVVRDTSGSTTKLYYNNAGTLQSVALA